VLTEWKALFIHFILMLFIQSREQNGMTPSLLLRQSACSYEFCINNVFALIIRMFAIVFNQFSFEAIW
jgi:hypothetical protein